MLKEKACVSRGHGTLAPASLVATTIAVAVIVLSARLEHMLAGQAVETPWAIVFSAASEGALAVLLLRLRVLIRKKAIPGDMWGLSAPAPARGSFADPGLVNPGRLSRHRRQQRPFARAFANALSDHRETERRLSLISDREPVLKIDPTKRNSRYPETYTITSSKAGSR